MKNTLRALSFLLLLGSTACASSGGTPELSSTAEMREGFRALDEAPSFELRYNPAACDCPPWEIATPQGWVRVTLLGDAEILETLQEQAWTDHGSEQQMVYAAEGALADRVLRCTPSTLCGEFKLTQWVAQEPSRTLRSAP
jgi:hypothetical protein